MSAHDDAPPERVILHVDMDAFFAAVEVLDDPSLVGARLIVGGDGRRGVVASCSYEARQYGVRSAMPSAVARRQCPGAVFRPARHDRYAEVSRQVRAVFVEFTPLVEFISIDEAFLDVTGARRLLGPPGSIAAAIRRRVDEAVHLPCSVGVAPTKFLAKLASEAAKPRADRVGVHAGAGVVVVEPGGELAFLHPLPIEALWGVGPATAQRLRAIGLTTVGTLAATPLAVVETAVGRASGRHLHDLANGFDPRRVEPDRAVKSIGHEETFPTDLWDRDELHRQLVRMSDGVASRLRRSGVVGRTVQIKVRDGEFATITRARTVSGPLAAAPAILAVAAELFATLDLPRGVRLLGVYVSSLEPAQRDSEQLTLDLERRPAGRRQGAAADAVDAVRARFGEGAVGPATVLSRPGREPGALL